MIKINEKDDDKLINGSLWFKHPYDFGKRNEILELRRKLGIQAIGIYWLFNEYLASDRENKNRFKDTDDEYHRAAIYIGGITRNKVGKIIKECISLGLFEKEKDQKTGEVFYYSELIRESIEKRKQKSEAGKLGMDSRWGNKPLSA